MRRQKFSLTQFKEALESFHVIIIKLPQQNIKFEWVQF